MDPSSYWPSTNQPLMHLPSLTSTHTSQFILSHLVWCRDLNFCISLWASHTHTHKDDYLLKSFHFNLDNWSGFVLKLNSGSLNQWIYWWLWNHTLEKSDARSFPNIFRTFRMWYQYRAVFWTNTETSLCCVNHTVLLSCYLLLVSLFRCSLFVTQSKRWWRPRTCASTPPRWTLASAPFTCQSGAESVSPTCPCCPRTLASWASQRWQELCDRKPTK